MLFVTEAYALHSPHSDAWETQAQPGTEKWSSKNVDAICGHQFQKGAAAYNSCVTRNQRKIGKPLTPGERQTLEQAGTEITTKTEEPKPTNTNKRKKNR